MSTLKEVPMTAMMTPDQAMAEALAEEMRRDATVITFGEGVATKGYKLVEEFGPSRVRNTPLAEGIIAGTAAGAAATGLRPVIDLLFAPFLTFAMDELVNSAGKLRYLSGGQFKFPLVAMTRTGGGWGVGAQHNHNVESWFVNTPGEVPDGEHVVPIGKAAVRREGTDVSLISYAKTVNTCAAAAEALAEQGVSAEVIDLRSLKPLDEATILASVRKTGRAIVVHEAAAPCGVGAEVSAILAEKAFSALKAPVVRLTGPDAPAAASFPLESAFAPGVDAIVDAAKRLI